MSKKKKAAAAVTANDMLYMAWNGRTQHRANCELCKAEKLTEWLQEDEVCYVCMCKDCNVWMIVLRRHTMQPHDHELTYMEMIVRSFFGDSIIIRKKPRKIKDHLHWHILEDDTNYECYN